MSKRHGNKEAKKSKKAPVPANVLVPAGATPNETAAVSSRPPKK